MLLYTTPDEQGRPWRVHRCLLRDADEGVCILEVCALYNSNLLNVASSSREARTWCAWVYLDVCVAMPRKRHHTRSGFLLHLRVQCSLYIT